MPNLTVSGNVDTMLGAADNAALRSAIGVGQTDAPTFLAQSLTGQSLTGTQATSLVDLSATWNTTGNPSLIYGRVTNTNSGTTANLIDLGTFAGGSLFKVSKTGAITANSTFLLNGSLVQSAGNVIPSGALILDYANQDVVLLRDAAGILAQRNGTNAQAFRVYNTFPGTGNNEWGGFDWITTANTLRIGTDKAASGGVRPLWFVSSSDVFRFNNTGVSGQDTSIFIGGQTGFSVQLIHTANYTPTGWTPSSFNLRLDCADEGFVIRDSSTFRFGFSRGGLFRLGGITDAFPAIARDGAGIKFTGAAAGLTSWIKVPAVAVASLPAAATAGVGARSFVNDALTPVFGSAVTGGGAVTVPVYSTGSAWNVG